MSWTISWNEPYLISRYVMLETELQLFPLILNLNGLDCFIRGVCSAAFTKRLRYIVFIRSLRLWHWSHRGFPAELQRTLRSSWWDILPCLPAGAPAIWCRVYITLLLCCYTGWSSRMIAWSSGNVILEQVLHFHYCNILTHMCSLSGSGSGGIAGLVCSGVI